MKILLILLVLAISAPAGWIWVGDIALSIDQWTPASSNWHINGLPNLRPVWRTVDGQQRVCTTVSWQYGIGGDLFADDPYGLYLFKPNFAGEGAVYYAAPDGEGVECWEFPVTCEPPRYLIVVAIVSYDHASYIGYADYVCSSIVPASVGAIKAMWGK